MRPCRTLLVGENNNAEARRLGIFSFRVGGIENGMPFNINFRKFGDRNSNGPAPRTASGR